MIRFSIANTNNLKASKKNIAEKCFKQLTFEFKYYSEKNKLVEGCKIYKSKKFILIKVYTYETNFELIYKKIIT
jgi:hypothetical protein